MRLDRRVLQRDRSASEFWVGTLKRLRTKVGFVLAALCIAEGIRFRERPFDLLQPSPWVALGFLLIASGLFLRVYALGYLRKKECLATKGVYSLCRHPLYLGSILLTYGFCVLLNVPSNFVVATVYFSVFYSLAIVREEVRLTEQYGEAHRLYREKTPLILPRGRFEATNFRWRCIKERKAVLLISAVTGLLMAVEVMADVFK